MTVWPSPYQRYRRISDGTKAVLLGGGEILLVRLFGAPDTNSAYVDQLISPEKFEREYEEDKVKTLRIGVDLDGVLYDFAASLRRYLVSIGYDPARLTPTRTWAFYYEWGMTTAGFKQACNNGVYEGYVFSGPARAGSAEALRGLKAAGHSIHIITDRSFGKYSRRESELATRIWLRNHNIPYDTLDFTADKTIRPTDVFVEDKIENYDALEVAGSTPWLVNRAWNYVQGGDARRRCTSVTDFASLVLAGVAQPINMPGGIAA